MYVLHTIIESVDDTMYVLHTIIESADDTMYVLHTIIELVADVVRKPQLPRLVAGQADITGVVLQTVIHFLQVSLILERYARLCEINTRLASAGSNPNRFSIPHETKSYMYMYIYMY